MENRRDRQPRVRPPQPSNVERMIERLDLTRALGYTDYLNLYEALKKKALDDPAEKDTTAKNKLLLDIINSARSARKEQVDTDLAQHLQAILEVIKRKVMEKLSPEDQEALMAEIRERVKNPKLIK